MGEAARAIILCFFFLFFIPIQDVVAKSLRAMEETRADRSLTWFKQRGAAPQSAKAFCVLSCISVSLLQKHLCKRKLQPPKGPGSR